jgi:hypothetical protein
MQSDVHSTKSEEGTLLNSALYNFWDIMRSEQDM